MVDNPNAPLQRTDGANKWLTYAITVASLVLLVIGNNISIKDIKIIGVDLDDLLNNVGLAALIAALTQYYTDFRVRSLFYKDISDHILNNQSLRDSGIKKFFDDSKQCIPTDYIRNATRIDIGMVYSDRFLKDNIGIFIERANEIDIQVFCPDLNDNEVLAAVALCIGREASEVKYDFKKLIDLISSMKNRGVKIKIYFQKSMPHYSFYAINNEYFFLTLSTFASRRANVPLFQAGGESPLAKLIRDDISHIMATVGSTTAVDGRKSC